MNLIINSTGKTYQQKTRKLFASALMAGIATISIAPVADAKVSSDATDNAPLHDLYGTADHNLGSHDTFCTFGDRSQHESVDLPRKIASELPLSVPLIPSQDPLPKPTKKLMSATMETTINAPLPFVWRTLTDFPGYPQIFPRIESCKVTKRAGNYVYTESNLKPQLFLREAKQKIVNDLNGKPHVLRWAMLEGNFENSQGCWELTPDENGKSCKVKYTLESTTDPVPKALASFTLKFVQKDIVKTFKRCTERLYQTREAQAGGSVAKASP